MSSSQNPVSPPAYQATGSSRKPLIDDAAEPLLGRARSPGGGFYDQPEQGDVPDDFKVDRQCSEASPVYSRLCDYSTALLFLRVPVKFGLLSSARFIPSYVSTLIVGSCNVAQPAPSVVCQIVRYSRVLCVTVPDPCE